MDLEVKICSDTSWPPDPPGKSREGAIVAHAIDILNEKFQNHEIQTVSLTGKRRFRELEALVRYQINQTGWCNTHSTVSNLQILTSYFAGQATIAVGGIHVNIRIVPDLPPAVRNYLLPYACGIYLPQDLPGSGNQSRNDSQWMLLLMWRCAFEQAVRKGSIPRSYICEEQNLRYFRGRLDIIRQIQKNLTDQSRFYCQYSPLSMDITINQVIRYVFKLINNTNSGINRSLFRSLATHDEMLASFGVKNAPVSPEQIDRISYHRMNAMYRPLMQLSKLLIRHFGAGDYQASLDSMAYFVDWTEIWENYLLKVLQKHIPDYTFISPNDLSQNDTLLACGRSIRPDFLVYKHGSLVAVMDAKYKNYTCIGHSSEEFGAISREDLYQMTTYLYHYSNNEKKIPGIFLAKGSSTGDQSLFKNGRSQIALVNLNLDDKLDQLRNNEQTFSNKVKAILEQST